VDLKKYRSLNYQGNFYNEADLKDFCREQLGENQDKIASWEKSIYIFIQEWLDKKDYIKVFTSGSTGERKEFRLRKEYMINSALKTGRYLNLKKGESALLCLSADYIAGKMMLVRSFVFGLNLFALNPSSKPLVELIKQPDFTALVPLQLSEILQDIQQKQILERIRNVIIGGGRLDHQLKAELQSMPNNIYESYGMTETSSHIALRKINGKDCQKYFQLMEGITISQDQRSCLQIEAQDLADDIIVTNDLVEIINHHEFDLLGRFDNLINSGGIKHIPELIEKKLFNLIPDPFIIASEANKSLGEMLILIIESKSKSLEEQSLIFDLLKSVLNKFEMPRKIYFTSPFSFTETGKINRKKVLKSLKKEE
jgi:o-succinylbenzoate---CoA ligase